MNWNRKPRTEAAPQLTEEKEIVAKDRIAYLFRRAEIDPAAVRKTKKSASLLSRRQSWHPTRYEPGKEPLQLPVRKRIVKSLVINTKQFLKEDGLIEIYVPGFGTDEHGNLQNAIGLEFEDGELKLSWMNEDGSYEIATIPRDKSRKARSASETDSAAQV